MTHYINENNFIEISNKLHMMESLHPRRRDKFIVIISLNQMKNFILKKNL